MYTQLNGRKLWYNGSITVAPETLMKRLELGQSVRGLMVDHITPDIEKFNRLVRKQDRIKIEEIPVIVHDFRWNIPETYKNLDIVEYVIQKFLVMMGKEKLSSNEITVRLKRIEEELTLFIDCNLVDVLLLMVYIIDTFKENNIVWGVGRGSSVSSYVLYVMEVHDIDSVKFELDIEDFIKPDKYKQSQQMED